MLVQNIYPEILKVSGDGRMPGKIYLVAISSVPNQNLYSMYC